MKGATERRARGEKGEQEHEIMTKKQRKRDMRISRGKKGRAQGRNGQEKRRKKVGQEEIKRRTEKER